MKIVSLKQGSQEWHAHRRTHFNASDAPAMMGCSPHETRAELVRRLATGITPEVTPQQQKAFDDGHYYETLARPIAEAIVGEDLSPVVGVTGRYSASFDGLTMLEETSFEHKSMNAALRASFDAMTKAANGEYTSGAAQLLPLMYRVQMEHQLMVSTDTERSLFMASRWSVDERTGEIAMNEEEHCWYYPDHALRASIVAGWEELDRDVCAYDPSSEQAPKAVGTAPEMLPALRIEMRGEVSASNLAEFRSVALSAIKSVNTSLSTDQDFADAEAAVKWCAEVESRLKAAKDHALSQTASIDALFRTIEEISEQARATRLKLEKAIKSEKEARRAEMIMSANDALHNFVAKLNAELGATYIAPQNGGFADVIKGMRAVEGMRDKIRVALTAKKAELRGMADLLAQNRKALIVNGRDFAFLFSDFAQQGQKEPELFDAIADKRIRDHIEREAEAAIQRKAAEDARVAAAVAAATAEAERKAAHQAIEAESRAMVQSLRPTPDASPAPASASSEGELFTFDPPPPGDNGVRIKLGSITERLGFVVTAETLSRLGFEAVGKERAAKLYRDSDWPAICDALVSHILKAKAAWPVAQAEAA